MSVRLDHGEDTLNEVHEINVTPFIDVMLVLLIIFMVAAPLATVDIQVNLPAASAQPQPRPDKPLYLSVKADLSLALSAGADKFNFPDKRRARYDADSPEVQTFYPVNRYPAR